MLCFIRTDGDLGFEKLSSANVVMRVKNITMSLRAEYKNLYTVIDSIISDADPAALGGTSGEYERVINEIVKFVIEEKMPISGNVLRQIFIREFPECNVSTLEEFSRMVENFNKMVQ